MRVRVVIWTHVGAPRTINNWKPLHLTRLSRKEAPVALLGFKKGLVEDRVYEGKRKNLAG